MQRRGDISGLGAWDSGLGGRGSGECVGASLGAMSRKVMEQPRKLDVSESVSIVPEVRGLGRNIYCLRITRRIYHHPGFGGRPSRASYR